MHERLEKASLNPALPTRKRVMTPASHFKLPIELNGIELRERSSLGRFGG